MTNAQAPKKIGKIKVDRALCIGAASCIALASDVFELDNENKAIVIQKGGQKDSGPASRGNLEAETTDENLMLAAQSCPTKAIYVYDEDGNQLYP